MGKLDRAYNYSEEEEDEEMSDSSYVTSGSSDEIDAPKSHENTKSYKRDREELNAKDKNDATKTELPPEKKLKKEKIPSPSKQKQQVDEEEEEEQNDVKTVPPSKSKVPSSSNKPAARKGKKEEKGESGGGSKTILFGMGGIGRSTVQNTNSTTTITFGNISGT